MNVATPVWRSNPQMPREFISTLVKAVTNALEPDRNAFTTVSARQTFGPSPTPVNGPTASAGLSNAPNGGSPAPSEKSTRHWPDPVRRYVQRSFAPESNIPGIGRQDMEKKLKEIISKSAESNTLDVVDWDNHPLPQQVINAEHERATQGISSSRPSNALSFPTHQLTNLQSEPLSRKRKSSEMEPINGDAKSTLSPPPWRPITQHTAFEDRVSFPEKRQRTEKQKGSSKSTPNLDSRKKRFDASSNAPWREHVSPSIRTEPEVDQGPVVGKSQALEKRYFRLTSAPNPDEVRPLDVLRKTLDHLKRKWKKEKNYAFICDQFKSLRQDLTVQHIKNEFTVDVYELHARIALEKGDLGEYNQCQTQLRALYAQNLGGHPSEFKAYRILYFIHTCNRTDMNDVLADLTPVEKKEPAIKHALDARSALALGNYHKFFQLYVEPPGMGAYLMDMFVTRERLAALSKMCKSYVFVY